MFINRATEVIMPDYRIRTKTFAREMMKDSQGRMLLITAVFLILTYCMTVLILRLTGYADFAESYLAELMKDPTAIPAVTWPEVPVYAIVLSAALLIFRTVLGPGFKCCCLMAVKRAKPLTKDLFNGFYFTGRTLLAVILNLLLVFLFCLPGLVVAVGLEILGLHFLSFYLGSLVSTVLGLWAYYKYSLSLFMLFDRQDISAFVCIRETAKMTRGRTMELFKMDISLLGWYGLLLAAYMLTMLFGGLPIMLFFAGLWVWPYRGICFGRLYMDMAHGEGWKPEEPAIEENTDPEV